MLAQRGCRLTVVPAKTSVVDVVKALNPDGIFLSNGPSDPQPCDYAIKSIRTLLEDKKPIFGISLRSSIIGASCRSKTKNAFGHHGANHPVQDLDSEKVFISSQNHGFEIDEKNLPQNIRITHRSLFDQSCKE